MNENPLLKVPPASRGNHACSVPLAKRGEPKGGGQFMNFERTVGMTPLAQAKFVKARMNGNPLLKVPPASRGNRTGAPLGSPREAGGTCRRGVIMNSGSAIGITQGAFITLQDSTQGAKFLARATD